MGTVVTPTGSGPAIDTRGPFTTASGDAPSSSAAPTAWTPRADDYIIVCGSPAMIRATVSSMLVAGTPLDRITYDPFTLD